MAKKIVGWIALALALGAMVLGIVWLSTNWDNLTAGTGIYTESDLDNKYDEGLADGMERGEEWRVLANEYAQQISSMENSVNALTILLEQERNKNNQNTELIDTLQSTIDSLNEQISTLESELQRVNDLLAGYEDIKNLTCEVTFEVNNKDFFSTVVKFGDKISSSILPEFTEEDREEYLAEVTGWTVDGEEVSLSAYQIVDDTTFIAEFTPVYTVTLDFEGLSTNYVDYVTDGNKPSSQLRSQLTACYDPRYMPEKDGYMFNGFLLDAKQFGSDIDEIMNLNITKNTTINLSWVQANKLLNGERDALSIYDFIIRIDSASADYTGRDLGYYYGEYNEIANPDNVVFLASDLFGNIQQAHFGQVIDFGDYTVKVDYRGSLNDGVDITVDVLDGTPNVYVQFYNFYEITEIARIGNYTIFESDGNLYAQDMTSGEKQILMDKYNTVQNFTNMELIYTNPFETDIFLRFTNEDGVALIDIDLDLQVTLITSRANSIEVYTNSQSTNWDRYADFLHNGNNILRFTYETKSIAGIKL